MLIVLATFLQRYRIGHDLVFARRLAAFLTHEIISTHFVGTDLDLVVVQVFVTRLLVLHDRVMLH